MLITPGIQALPDIPQPRTRTGSTVEVVCVYADGHATAFKEASKRWPFPSAIYAPQPVGRELILALSSISHACSTS